MLSMAPRTIKFLCLVLIVAALAGVLAGCQSPAAALSDTANYTAGTSSSSAPTVPTTAPESTQPQLPEAEPLPPGSPPTLQLSTAKKPLKPDVVIPKLSAKDFFIYDTRIDDYLYISCDTDKMLYPASITKLFTTYVALQYLQPEDIVTVGGELSYVAYDASTAGFRKGDRVSVEALAYSALLPSGCDASYILAAAAGKVILGDKNATAKNAINAFMKECNRIGKELGMENTHFVTPDGYHDDAHKVSVQAFVIIGKCSLENKLIARITADPTATITYKNSSGKTCTKTFTNTNHIIQSESNYYQSLCVGLKTGFTNAAGYCLLTAYKVDGRYILVGIFGCSDSTDRFKDANKLLNTYLPYL